MDTLQIIDKINGFYSTSFSQLITITIAILGFSGIVLPIIIQFMQNRTFRIEQKFLQVQIDQEIKLATAELKTEISNLFTKEKETIQAQLKAELSLLKTSMENKFNVAQAGTFFIQAVNKNEKKQFAVAARDYAFAAEMFLKGLDDLNGQRAIKGLIEVALPKIDSSSFDSEPQLGSSIEDLLKLLGERNDNNRFQDTITSIKTGVSQAKKRNPTPRKPV
jgi:hypothetical protein